MKKRCAWVPEDSKPYIDYHDKEWGVPVHSDQKHFEMLILEGAQAGLSWSTILNKRQNYRKIYDNFEPKKVAKYDNNKIQQLLQNEGIVRNKLKIHASVKNAKAFLKIQKEHKSFDKYIWAFVNNTPIQNNFSKISEVPASTEASDTISKELKKRGMSFVGSTIIYAYMQAIGMVNDHTTDCFRHKQLKP